MLRPRAQPLCETSKHPKGLEEGWVHGACCFCCKRFLSVTRQHSFFSRIHIESGKSASIVTQSYARSPGCVQTRKDTSGRSRIRRKRGCPCGCRKNCDGCISRTGKYTAVFSKPGKPNRWRSTHAQDWQLWTKSGSRLFSDSREQALFPADILTAHQPLNPLAHNLVK